MPPHPDIVREAIASGTSKADLAREAGIHPNTLANVADPEWSPRWKTLEALCNAAATLKAKEK